jgi:molecular chaperone GrpE (heat shock protein)
MNSALFILLLLLPFYSGYCFHLFRPCILRRYSSTTNLEETEIKSDLVISLEKKIEITTDQISRIQNSHDVATKELRELEEKFGPSITQIKNDLKIMKERDESKEIVFSATTNAFKEILPTFDSFYQFQKHYSSVNEMEDAKIAAEYSRFYDEVRGIFNSFGITRVDTLGKQYDPSYMEAVAVLPPNDKFKDGEVCEEYEAAYLLMDRCIRSAKVAVARENSREE